MEELNGTTIYWLVSIGLMIGYVTKIIMGSRGMTLKGNLIVGVIGSLVVGTTAILYNLFGALIYATMGTSAILFLINVFNIEPKEARSTDISR